MKYHEVDLSWKTMESESHYMSCISYGLDQKILHALPKRNFLL